ncbi:MAG: sulfite exporter TauE/SafE family protein [Lautropia sp.]|nr:sulfite exporter TauE/SafE family protein [Lautropia sp.]
MLDLSTLQIGALIVSLAFTGVIAGVLAGLLGVGGGIVIVPVLFWVFGLLALPVATSMHLAVGTSLATIVATSWASMRAHSRRGSVDRPLLHLWGPAIFIGAAIGGVAAKYIDGNGLRLIFGIVALLVSINMALPRQLKVSDSLPVSLWVNRLIATVIGLFSALMGTGGGTLSVPTLTAFSFPIHRAVGTASFVGMLIAVPAVAGFIWSGAGVPDRPPLSLGFVSLPAVAIIFPMTMTMAPVGVRLAHRLNQRRLKIAFALFLFITAARMLYTAFDKYF